MEYNWDWGSLVFRKALGNVPSYKGGSKDKLGQLQGLSQLFLYSLPFMLLKTLE